MASGASRPHPVFGEPDSSPWARAEDEAVRDAAAILGTAAESLTASIAGAERALAPATHGRAPATHGRVPAAHRHAPAPGGGAAFRLVVGGAALVLVMVTAMAVALGAQRSHPASSPPPASLSALVPAQGTPAPRSTQHPTQASTPRPTLHPTAHATPRPTPAVRTAPVLYHVVSGDTLTAIAARYQVAIAEIVKANRIADPNLIYTGQTLVIPPSAQSAP